MPDGGEDPHSPGGSDLGRPTLDDVAEQLTALAQRLSQADVAGDIDHQQTSSTLSHLQRLAEHVRLHAEGNRRDVARIEQLTRTLVQVGTYCARQAAHYGLEGVGEARAWRHVQYTSEQALMEAGSTG